jgi:hypothetical protein
LTRRNRKLPRRERKRTAETVVRTQLAVVTAPANNGSTIGVQHEVELVKASLLYADSVEVLSLGGQMIREMNKFAAGDGMNLYSLLYSLDDDTLRSMSPDLDLEQFRQFLPLLTSLNPEQIRAIASADPELAEFSELADIVDDSHNAANTGMAEIRAYTDRLRVESGVAELEPALHARFVRFNDKIRLGEGTDAEVEAFVRQLKRYLQDPNWFVLLDAEIASLARSMINEGLVKPPARAISNAGEAALGTGFVSRLPAFTDPPMDELLDLRRDLDEPLGRYRRKVSHLRSELRTEPFDEYIEAEIDHVWRTEVDPAIGEIRQAMADHGLVKEQLRAFAGDLGDFVKGRSIPTGLTIFSANVLDIGDVLSIGLNAAGAGMAAAPAIAKGLLARADGRAKAKAHDLYYLYEVDRRLS